MIKQVFKTMVAFLAVATMTIGPVRGQNATTYTVAGSNAAMFGSPWDASYTANDMTMNGDGTYSITYTNVYLDDDVQYKVVKDHSWNEAYPDGNRVINIAEAGTYTVTIHFNPTTHEVYEAMPTPHTVRFAAGNDGWQVQDVTASASATAPAVLQNVMAGDSLVVTAPAAASLPGKVKSVKAVKYVPPVLVQSIVLNKQTASLAKDSTMTLSATVLPENAADKSYSWSSDDIAVADVDQNGVVIGHNAGTANIIATANDGSGAKDTCVVTVLSPVILDGVTVLYASDNDLWSTVMGYNPGVMYLDGDNVRLTSNDAVLFRYGFPASAGDFFYPLANDEYQWMLEFDFYGSKFYYHQGETWQQAIDANRPNNQDWSIVGGQVKYNEDYTLVDTNDVPVAPTATIDPTVNYDLMILDN